MSNFSELDTTVFKTLKTRLSGIKIYTISLPVLKSDDFNDWKIIVECKLTIFSLQDFILKRPNDSIKNNPDFKCYDNFVKANLVISVTETLLII